MGVKLREHWSKVYYAMKHGQATMCKHVQSFPPQVLPRSADRCLQKKLVPLFRKSNLEFIIEHVDTAARLIL